MDYRQRKFQALTIFFFSLISFVFSASMVGAFYHTGSSLERTSNNGGVKISAQYLVDQSSQIDGISFQLNLSTHYVDLDKYDIQSLSFVRVDEGPLQPATKWVATGEGHHIKGILKFVDQLPPGSHQVQLIVKDIGNTGDRIFEWKAPVE